MAKGSLQIDYEKLVMTNLELKEQIKELEGQLDNARDYLYGREKADLIQELKAENAKLNIILYHRENGLSHPDFKAEIEISKQAEQITELEAELTRLRKLLNAKV